MSPDETAAAIFAVPLVQLFLLSLNGHYLG